MECVSGEYIGKEGAGIKEMIFMELQRDCSKIKAYKKANPITGKNKPVYIMSYYISYQQ